MGAPEAIGADDDRLVLLSAIMAVVVWWLSGTRSMSQPW